MARLARVITEGRPDAVVLIGHDVAGQVLDVAGPRALGNAHVFLERGGYGGFSHVDRYLAAVDWLDAHGVDYDWLENLSSQDYPLRPIAEIEDALAEANADGFLQYSPVFPERVPGGVGQGTPGHTLVRPVDAATRYDCRHWRLGRPTPAKRRWLRPLMVLNFAQPWIRVLNSYASVGIRRRTVFGPGFHCYGGSFFCTLRAECARYVRDYARANPEMVAFFRGTAAPEEAFLHSLLVNSAGSTSTRTTSATSTGPAAPTPTRGPWRPQTCPRCWPAARTGPASSTRGRTPGCSTSSTSGSGPGRCWP